MFKALSLIATFLIFESKAHAYIDPGLSGTTYRIIYLTIFIALIFWLLKPHHTILKILSKLKEKSSDKKQK